MKTLHRLTYLAVIYGLLLAAARADENSAPYFQIVGNRDAAASESLPLKSSSAKVSIDGTIAKVHLTQRYANSGSVPIEAIYVFPASTRAAVHGMTLTTGGRVIAAIRGAAELLDEDMPVEVRKCFLENIRAETARSERLINRLLELAAIEG